MGRLTVFSSVGREFGQEMRGWDAVFSLGFPLVLFSVAPEYEDAGEEGC